MGQPPYPNPYAPVTAPLTNPNPNVAPINYPPPVTIQPTTTTPATTPATTAPAAAPTDPQNSSPDSYNVLGAPQGPNGGYTVAQITAASDAEVSAAQQQVTQIWGSISPLQTQVQQLGPQAQTNPLAATQLNDATQQLDTLYNQLGVAETRLQNANATRANALNTAQHNGVVDQSNADLLDKEAAKAQADADYAKQQADVLSAGAPGQRDLVAANAAQASATALAQKATADATTAKTPAEIQQLQAQSNQMNALATQATAQADTIKQQGGLYGAQAANIQALTGPQVDYTKAQAAAQNANAAANQAQAALTTARIPGEVGLLGAQTTSNLAGAAANVAQAQATQATTQKNLLGPAYGLADQINYLKQNVLPVIQTQVFGPGGTGDPQHANDLLNQYISATLGGTTIGQAAAAAATAQQNNYATQVGGVNALQQAQASRANQYASLAGQSLGTLAQMNAYAPKGSTAMAGAFESIMDMMANRLAQPQFAPVQIPNTPPMPSFLQGFLSGHQAGTAQATAGSAPAGGGGQSPTINVNVNGQPAGGTGATFNPQASTAAMNAAGFMDNPAGRAAMAAAAGAGGGGIPAFAQNYMPFANPNVMSSAAPAGAPASAYGTPPPIINPPAGPSGAAQTPQQAFVQGFGQTMPGMPSMLGSYGLNLSSPMQMLGGQPYVGMGI